MVECLTVTNHARPCEKTHTSARMGGVTTRHNASQRVTTCKRTQSLGVTTCHSVPQNQIFRCHNASRQSQITHDHVRNAYFCTPQRLRNASQRVTTCEGTQSLGVTTCHRAAKNLKIRGHSASRQSHLTHGHVRKHILLHAWVASQRVTTRHNASQRAREPKVSASQRVTASRKIKHFWCHNASRHSHITHDHIRKCLLLRASAASQRVTTRHNAPQRA